MLCGKYQGESLSLFKLGITIPSLSLCTPATMETDVVMSIWKPREAQLWPANALDQGHGIAASPDHILPATLKPEGQDTGATISAMRGPRGRSPCSQSEESRNQGLEPCNYQHLEQCYLEDVIPGPRQLTAWARLATISARGQQSECHHKGTSAMTLWGP